MLQNIGKLGLPKGDGPGQDKKEQIKFHSAAEDQEHCSLFFHVFFMFCFLFLHVFILGISWGLLQHWILHSLFRGSQILNSDSRLERQVLLSISIWPSVSVLLLKQGISWNEFTFTFNVPASVLGVCISTVSHCVSNEAVTKLFRPHSILKCLSAALCGWASARAPILFQTRPGENTKKYYSIFLLCEMGSKSQGIISSCRRFGNNWTLWHFSISTPCLFVLQNFFSPQLVWV